MMWMFIIVLAFFLVTNTTFAYFTSTTSAQTSETTAKLTIRFSDNTKLLANSEIITSSTLVLPGDTLSASGSVTNAGNTQAYVIIVMEISVTKFGETDSEVVDKAYYTISETTTSQITKVDDEYLPTAFILNEDETKSFSLNYVLDFNSFDNEYQKATITYSLKAYAIQTVTITNASEGTKILIENIVV